MKRRLIILYTSMVLSLVAKHIRKDYHKSGKCSVQTCPDDGTTKFFFALEFSIRPGADLAIDRLITDSELQG